MTMVRDALKPFIQEICDDPNTIIKLVLFDHDVETVIIPKDPKEAGSVIEARVYASGGTDFHSASKGLVTEARAILSAHPTYQVLLQRNFFKNTGEFVH